MCQADNTAGCEDGVAPEGALHLSEGDGAMERGEAYWTYDAEAGAWYFGLNSRAAPPYLTQRHFDAIVDLDADGRLVGIELLQPLLPSRSPTEEATSVADTKRYAAMEADETLSGYTQMFRDLMQAGRTANFAAGYVLARATRNASVQGLVQERERAAKIASDEADLQRAKWSHLVQNDSSQTASAFAKGGAESAKRIAAAIRGDSNG